MVGVVLFETGTRVGDGSIGATTIANTIGSKVVMSGTISGKLIRGAVRRKP